MSNFKVGEKVVFVMQPDAKPRYGSPINVFNLPQQNEIVEIHSFYGENHVNLVGYLNNKKGGKQSFHIRHIRKLDHQFSEDVIADIIKKVKEEELTLSN